MISNFDLIFSFTILDLDIIDYNIPIFWDLFFNKHLVGTGKLGIQWYYREPFHMWEM